MECQKKEIGGRTYSVTQLGARDGWKVLAKVTALVGAALKALGPGVTLSGLKSAGAAGVGGMLETVATGLAGEWATVELLCKGVQVSTDNGMLVPMPEADVWFGGKYEVLAEFLEFALEVNFAGFFTKLASRAGLAPNTPMPPSSSSPAA